MNYRRLMENVTSNIILTPSARDEAKIMGMRGKVQNASGHRSTGKVVDSVRPRSSSWISGLFDAQNPKCTL